MDGYELLISICEKNGLSRSAFEKISNNKVIGILENILDEYKTEVETHNCKCCSPYNQTMKIYTDDGYIFIADGCYHSFHSFTQ